MQHGVSILLDRRGVLRSLEGLSVGTNPYQVRSADFNGDGVPDLVVGNVTGQPPPGSDPAAPYTLSILLGQSADGFVARARYELGQGSSGIATGDFNGDGRTDLAVTSFDDNLCFVLMGKGDGTFDAPRSFATGAAPLDVIAVDLNGDGVADLVTANAHAKSLSVLMGKGDGTFAAQTEIPVHSYPKSLATGDFNGDGRRDLVVSNYLDNSISILLNTGYGR